MPLAAQRRGGVVAVFDVHDVEAFAKVDVGEAVTKLPLVVEVTEDAPRVEPEHPEVAPDQRLQLRSDLVARWELADVVRDRRRRPRR